MTRTITPIALLLLLAGCAPDVGDGTPRPPAPKAMEPLTTRSTQGKLIQCRVFGNGRTVVLIVGGIHGSEPAGAALACVLNARLDGNPACLKGRTVLVVDIANPDGLVAESRGNARGVDINRNFPSPNWAAGRATGSAPQSEPETRFLASLIRRHRPACVVQIHQPLACVDWDGPARELAQDMARACGLKARKLGARPGSLGSYAGVELGIPTITLELPKNASRLGRDALWERYGPALLVAIRSAESPAPPDRLRMGGSIETRWEHIRSGR